MIKQNLLTFLLLTLIVSFCSVSVFSAGIANVVLSSQDPDPIRPGNFVDLSFKISNSGDETISNARFELIENDYITLASTEEKRLYLGSIPAFSSVDDGFTVAKIRVFVDDNTPVGDQEVEVKMIGSSQEFTRVFTITVKEESPSLEIDLSNNLQDLTFKPGEQKELTLTLNNLNSISVKDVKLTVDTSVTSPTGITTSNDFYVLGSTNVKRVDLIKAKDTSEVSFNLGISPTASIRPYQIPMTLEYEDALGNTYEEKVEVAILVNSGVDLLVTLDRVEGSRLTFGLANPGPGVVKGAFVTVMDSSGEEISAEYIGDLNADDFQTIQVDSTGFNVSNVKVNVDFFDGYYSEDTTQKDFSINSNITTTQGSSSMGTFVVIVLVLIGAGYFVLRRRNKKN